VSLIKQQLYSYKSAQVAGVNLSFSFVEKPGITINKLAFIELLKEAIAELEAETTAPRPAAVVTIPNKKRRLQRNQGSRNDKEKTPG
jgi:hypothetical protein